MIISVQCPACQTSFPVDPRKVPEGGVKVRCSACSGIFFVDKPQTPPPSDAVPAAPEPAAVPESGAAAAGAAAAGMAGAAVADAAPEPTAGEGEPAPASTPAPEAGSDDRDGADDGDGTSHAAAPEDDEVDPWSGANWDDPSDVGAHPHEGPADPWSGGVGLDDGRDGPEVDAEPAPEVEAEAEQGGEDWVIERAAEDHLAAAAGDVERLDTVEEQVRAAADEWQSESGPDEAGDDGDAGWDDDAVPPAAEAPVPEPEASPPAPDGGFDADAAAPTDAGAAEAVSEALEDAASHAPAFEDAPAFEAGPAGPPEPESPPARPAGFQFGKRDPHDKAKRLARVLVSDIITYNPERHQRALEQDSLHADFEEEIKKSWAEYVEQVGQEIAESTPYWFDALNEILARGRKVF